MEKHGMKNIEPILVHGYTSIIPDDVERCGVRPRHVLFCKASPEFLRELKRKTGKDGPLIIDDGHQRRSVTKKKILDSGLWIINWETWDRLKCRPS